MNYQTYVVQQIFSALELKTDRAIADRFYSAIKIEDTTSLRDFSRQVNSSLANILADAQVSPETDRGLYVLRIPDNGDAVKFWLEDILLSTVPAIEKMYNENKARSA